MPKMDGLEFILFTTPKQISTLLQNNEKRVLLSKMLQGLVDDLESWIIMLFVERKADDIHYFDASFSENCFVIESTFMQVEKTDNPEDENDLEFF